VKLKTIAHCCFALSAALAAMSNGNAMAADNMLVVAEPGAMSQWYGRAGGLVGSDRVMGMMKAAKVRHCVRVAYSKEVAERTNMHREEAANGCVTSTYDKGVAARTNMPRDAP